MKTARAWWVHALFRLVAPRACSIMIFGALFCTLTVKFFHSWRTGLVAEYSGWILSDIAVLAGIEVALAVICSVWPRKSVIRAATVFAVVVCSWSVINAGWLVRTGTQVLPSVLLPLVYDPLGTLGLVGGNLLEMPIATIALLVPSAIAIGFVVFVMVRPSPPPVGYRRLGGKIVFFLILITTALVAAGLSPLPLSLAGQGRHKANASGQAGPVPSLSVSTEMDYNCQLRAVTSLLSTDSVLWTEEESGAVRRRIPTIEDVADAFTVKSARARPNIVLVVLEGVQYKYTSLADPKGGLTPYLATLAAQGVEFTNTRATVTHTTKAFFGLLTGRYPCAVEDVSESVPAAKPYASLATILKHKLDYRSACFESATGSFECWPGLMHNLGFDKFWARENLDDPNAFVGYFASDEFAMIGPMVEWIKADDKPFLLAVVCSVTHDPYEVPRWFASPEKEPLKRYRQTIAYTDRFLAAVGAEIGRLNLSDNTIFCVISDHAEAFGEHGLFAHERIGFEEVLRVPWVIRYPSLLEPGRKVDAPVSSVDLAPTLLSLVGLTSAFDDLSRVASSVEPRTDPSTLLGAGIAGFDGLDALGDIPADRKVYFSCWNRMGPAGFVQGNRKFIYAPINKAVTVYDLARDPLETAGVLLNEQRSGKIADEILAWRGSTVFKIPQRWRGRTVLFDQWACSWMGRICSARYNKPGSLFARLLRTAPASTETDFGELSRVEAKPLYLRDTN